ncbi:MAG: hypothetical protein QJR08_00375 [Bacillota bacterium]|nr:hypothetical protein [Bacillota bacterium]
MRAVDRARDPRKRLKAIARLTERLMKRAERSDSLFELAGIVLAMWKLIRIAKAERRKLPPGEARPPARRAADPRRRIRAIVRLAGRNVRRAERSDSLLELAGLALANVRLYVMAARLARRAARESRRGHSDEAR